MPKPEDSNNTSNIIPEENAVSSRTGFNGPEPTPRDKSPEHQYKPRPGDNNNFTGADAPGGPVNIGVKGAAGEAEQDIHAPDDGVTQETKEKTTGRGKYGV